MRQLLVCLAGAEETAAVGAAAGEPYELSTEMPKGRSADLLVVDTEQLKRHGEQIRDARERALVRSVLWIATSDEFARVADACAPFDDIVSRDAPRSELAARISLAMTRATRTSPAAASPELERHVQELGFRALAEDTPDVVARYDRNLRYQYVNAAVTRATGLIPEAMLGKTHRELGFTAEHAEFWDETIRSGFATGESARVTFTLVRPEGLRYFESRLAPERAPDGTITSVLVVSRDMTDRVLAEAAVRISEARLGEAMALARTGSWEFDPKTRAASWSKELPRLLGYEPDEQVPDHIQSLLSRVHPEDHQALRQLRALAEEPGDTRTVEFRLLLPNGQVRHLLTRARSSIDPSTQRQTITGVTTDITDRKFRELERDSEHSLLELVARGAPIDEVLHFMARTQESLFPGTYCELRIAAGDELKLAAGLDAFPDVRAALSSVPVTVGGLPCARAALQHAPVRADDLMTAPCWQEWRERALPLGAEGCLALPIASAQHPLLGTLAIYFRERRPPSAEETRWLERAASLAGLAVERDRTHAALAASEALLRTVFDNSPIGIYLCDATGRVVYVNRAVTEVLEVPREKVLGRRWFARLHRDDRRAVAERLRALLDGRVASLDLTWRLPLPSGELKTLEVHANSITGAAQGERHRRGFVGTVEDITARVKLEDQLRHAQKMEAVGQLAGGVAHDFNNLLTVILNGIALLDPQRSPKDRNLLRQVELAAERASALTKQLLAFGRRQRMSTQVVDLNELVSNLCDMLRRLIGEQNTLEAELAPGGAHAQVDPNMIEQVLLNLVVNARDAMPRGGKIVLKLRAVPNGGGAPSGRRAVGKAYLCLSVIDTGVGIAQEHLPRVFEPFFTTKEPGKGTGLGLATVYAIVERHGGFVEIESQLEGGTTVNVYLPRAASLAREGTARLAPPLRGSETILLAEDEHAVREMVRTSLESCGYRVLEANSGDEALAIWQERGREVSLLVTDMVMPGSLLGGELAARLRADRPSLRVVYMSGYGGQDLTLDPLSRFIAKPFQISTLGQLVRECLDASSATSSPSPAPRTQPQR